MTRIRFEDLPSTNTPRNAENLNKLNNVVISPTEPTTGEEVWIDNINKKLYTKNDNEGYQKFYDARQGITIYDNDKGGNDIGLSSYGQGMYWINTSFGNGFFIWNGTELNCYGITGTEYVLNFHVRAEGMVSAWALNNEGGIASYPTIYKIIKVLNF